MGAQPRHPWRRWSVELLHSAFSCAPEPGVNAIKGLWIVGRGRGIAGVNRQMQDRHLPSAAWMQLKRGDVGKPRALRVLLTCVTTCDYL